MARILLLDDDIAEITAVKRLVARSAHRAELATTAADAARAIGRDPPDLLVVAAACDGGRALSVIRDAGAPLRVIVLGEPAGLPGGVRAVGLPVDPEQLGREIDGLLGTSPGTPSPSPRNPSAAPPSSRRPLPREMGASLPAWMAGADGLERARAAAASPRGAPEPLALGAAGRLDRAEDPRGWADELTASVAAQPPAAARAAAEARPRREDVEARQRAEDAEARRRAESEEEERLRAAIASARAELEVMRRRPARAPTAPAAPRREGTPPLAGPPEPTTPVVPAAEPPGAHRPGFDRPLVPIPTVPDAISAAFAPASSPPPSIAPSADAARTRSPADSSVVRPRAVPPSETAARSTPRPSISPEPARSVVDAVAPAEPAARTSPDSAASRRHDPARDSASKDGAPRPPRFTPAPRAQATTAPAPEDAAAPSTPPVSAPDPTLEAGAPRPPRFTPAPRAQAPSDPAPLAPLAATAPPRTTPAPVLPPPPEALRAGTLAELPAPRLLALAAAARLAGRLDLESEVTRSLWFEGGRVVGAVSADPAERVEALAVRFGLVTRDQHQQISGRAATLPARRAALLLLDAGFLKATELSGLVRRRTEEVVFGIFGDAGARFRWEPGEVPADERGPVERPPLALAVEGVRRRWSAARLDAVLGGPDTLLSPVPDGPPAEALALSSEERQMAALADGLRTVAEIERGSPLDSLAARQVLAALVLVGALEVRRLAGLSTAEEARAIDQARLADRLDQARRCDYFTVLGLPRSSTSHEAREAAGRLEADLDPDRLADRGDATLAAGLGDLLQVVRDARAVLGDEGLRRAYLAALGE